MIYLVKYWKPAAVLLLLLVLSTCCYKAGSDATDAKWSARWHQHVAEDATLVAKAATEAREQEAQWAAAFDVTAQIQQEELTNVQKHRDRLLADLRAGRLRLPSACPARLPEAAADSGESPESSDSGQPAMAGELVNRLAVCDEVTLERNQAVELLRAERH